MNWLIRLLGGYPTISDAIEAIKEDKDKRRILSLAVKDLYNTIGADDILKEVGGKWIVGGRELTDGEKNQLIAEAKQFYDTHLWKILRNDIQYLANRKMFILSQTQDDLVAGKMFLYTFDAIETRLKRMKEGLGHYNKK